MSTPSRRRKFWGWGLEGEGLDAEQARAFQNAVLDRTGGSPEAIVAPPTEAEVTLRPPRLRVDSQLAEFVTDAHYERLVHSYGKSLPDSIRAFQRSYPEPPDAVAYPRNETEVVAVLEWAARENAAVIPFGGGSSVCGGVEPAVGDTYDATVSLDLMHLGAVLEIDETSLAARIQGGAYGPALEARLKERGLTLRHFPQSFEYSTLGGWIATRSGGHFATRLTHIDDLVESLRVVTPNGTIETRRLPGSGAGPSPDRLFIGSEGTLGVITEAWMRIRPRPTFRESAAATFDDFFRAAEAVRALSQSDLLPSNCRLIDAEEARTTGASTDGSLLVLGFESADHPVTAWMDRAIELVRDHGGHVERATSGRSETGARDGAAGAWRRAFLQAPYYRELLTPLGVLSDTFETAITWDRFEELHQGIVERMQRAFVDVTGLPGTITCRFTHVYPDGPAPYFTFRAAGRFDGMLDQWRELKAAANEVVVALGGTVTHHHAVGRDHRPGWERQRPALFEKALRAAKAALDPAGLLNPGVLFDPLDHPVGVTGAMHPAT